VPGALIALQNADRSLSRSDKPQFITIRRAIARDTDKLKALPSVDSVGVALRLDNAIAQIDTLPMLSDEKPTLPAPPEKKAKAKVVHGKDGKPVKVEETTSPWLQALQDGWNGWSSEMWTDVPADPRAQCRYAGCADAVADPGLLPAREPEAAPAECAHGAAVA
jgi:uroporphyrin-3 C-methyltransferase/uroporphyrinogen III methyltransferase/synthase